MVILSDPIFVEVVNLLQDQNIQASNLTATLSRTPLLSSVQKLKSKSDEWQRIISSTQAVEEMSGPILHEFKKLEKNRDRLVETMERADRLVPEDLSWPPTTQRLSLEREQFKKLEIQFRDFKKTRQKAIQLVSIISDLSDQYRELNSVVGQVLDKASQEHKQFEALERRLHQSKSMWSDRLAENTANTALVTEIENLLESSNRDFIELQKRAMNGSLPYQQAYQMFRRLNRELDNASLQAGGNQIIDITGSLHRQL
jgi:hypothetical protein